MLGENWTRKHKNAKGLSVEEWIGRWEQIRIGEGVPPRTESFSESVLKGTIPWNEFFIVSVIFLLRQYVIRLLNTDSSGYRINCWSGAHRGTISKSLVFVRTTSSNKCKWVITMQTDSNRIKSRIKISVPCVILNFNCELLCRKTFRSEASGQRLPPPSFNKLHFFQLLSSSRRFLECSLYL